MKSSDKKVLTVCAIDEGQWLDYLEGDISESFKVDLDTHKKSCAHCQDIFDELTATKSILARSEVALPGDDFFKTLEGKIMMAVDSEAAPMAVTAQSAGANVVVLIRKITLPLAATAALFLLVLGAMYKTSGFNRSVTTDLAQSKLEEQFIVQAAQNDPKVITNIVINPVDEEEVVKTAAAEKLSKMSRKDAAKWFKELR